MKIKLLHFRAYACLLTAFLLVTASVNAETYYVTNMNSSGAGSLSDAINSANAADGNTIAFLPNLSGTINVTSLIYITKSMTINGNGKLTLSGQTLYSIFAITDNTTTLKTVAIRGLNFYAGLNNAAGSTTLVDFTSAQLYGAITSRETLVLENVTVESCAGGVFVSGKSTAIAQPNLTVRNCKFLNLSVRPAIFSTQGTSTNNYLGDVLIEHAVFQGCTASAVTLQSPNSMIVRNCSFTGNIGISYGTALVIRTEKAGTLTTALVENTTVAYNTNASNSGGAVYTYIYFNNIPVTFRNCTFYGNLGGPTTSGGTPRQLYFNGANIMNLYNCIIGGASDGPDYGTSGGGTTFTANFYNSVLGLRNFFSGTGNDGAGNGNITSDPKLSLALSQNGGFVPTLAFTDGTSPAINLGLSANATTTDARGMTRDFAGSRVDAGAYERGSSTFAYVGTSVPVNNTTNADIAGNISINFGHPVSKGSGNIRIYDGSNTLLATIPVTSGSVTILGNTVTVAAGLLPQDRLIYVQADAGAFTATIDGTSATSAAISNTTSITFTTGNSVTLPVGLIRFSAIAEGERNKLAWEVGSEEENDSFLVYRGRTATDFELIATVKGTNGLQQHYTLYDNQPLTGKNFYRLDQRDWDGRQTILGYAQVNFQMRGLLVKAYPNPVTKDVTVACFDRNLLGTNARLCDLGGKTWLNVTMKELQVIPMDSFPVGFYLLKLMNGQTIKLIKK